MMLGNRVTVFSGTGYIGREVVNALSKEGYEVKLCVRRPERYRDFALYNNTKVVALTSYDDAQQLDSVLAGADIVVNLTADRTNGTEMVELGDLVHVNQKIKQAAEHAGVKRVLSLSQIGASANQEANEFLCKLGESDALMHSTASADVTIFKPSLVIGENDDTTQRFVKQLNRMDLLMVANGDTVVQPIWVKDFAEAMVNSIKNAETFGEKLDVAGEERLTLKELGDLVAEMMQKDVIVFPMCSLNAKIMAMFGAFAPVVSVSRTQLKMLKEDMITDTDFDTQFGFVPSSLEWVVSNYAAPHHIRERYNYFRKEANRNADELV
ncbi:MAG: NAD(P)H-binding protein [Pseudomonadota bacterium]|nr:NAD(P)H-binding protein [Pseudomonadota bacterium]